MFRIENASQSYFKKFSSIQRKFTTTKVIQKKHNVGDMKLSTNIFQTLNDGWLICNGESLPIASFPELFSIIGKTFGSLDNDHFNLPDYTSRVIGIIGKSKSQSFSLIERKMGESVGTEVETLSIENLPRHSHNGVTDLAGLHTHYSKMIESTVVKSLEKDILNESYIQTPSKIENTEKRLMTSFSSESGTHRHCFISNEIGEGQAHNNIQPTLFGSVVLIYAKH